MGHTILEHNLGTTELQVGSINLATKDLIKGRGTSKDDRLAFNLDSTLAKADEIGADTDGTGSDKCYGENLILCPRGCPRHTTRPLHLFTTNTILQPAPTMN